jgi:hypothetical protein
MGRELGGELGRQLGVQAGARHAVHHQTLDVATNELLLARVEVTIDIPERGQVKDDRPHLLLRLGPIRAELEHRGRIQRLAWPGNVFLG